jgi:hypothetical protein
MTSRRNPPRRSSGSRTALLLASIAFAAVASAEPATPPPSTTPSSADLIETRDGVTVDWRAGTVSASGGAAADLRMPSVDLARPGAERRARAAATAKLRTALRALPASGGHKLDPERIDRALNRARAVDVQYQSNGGAVIRMEVRFADWLEDPGAPTAALAVRETHLAAAPRAVVGGQEISLGAATYRVGSPPADAGAHPARVDHSGRLVLDGGRDLAAKLAHGVALIYVQKVQR